MNNNNQEPKENLPDKFPSLNDIESAWRELEDYNRTHTGASAVAKRVLKPMLEKGDSLMDPEIDAQAELALDLTSMTTSPIFKSIGLERYDTKRDGAFNKESWIPGGQGLYVHEPALFDEFIKSQSGDLQASPVVSDMIVSVYQNMLRDIETIKDEERDAVLGDLEDVNMTLKDVKFANKKPNFELGQAFINWGKKPEFDDFLIMRELGLSGKGTWSAAEWHKDSSKERYVERWNELLAHYEAVNSKYGEENELTILMKLEIQDALKEAGDWINNPDYDNKEYLKNIKEAYKLVCDHAKYLYLMPEEN